MTIINLGMTVKIKEGVLSFNSFEFNLLSKEAVGSLIREANSSFMKRARINFHPPNANVHEMCICLMKDTVLPVHRHFDKSESFHVIDGRLGVILFQDNQPEVLETLILDSKTYQRYYRLDQELYHLVIPLTDHVLMLETTSGPYDPRITDIAPWSTTKEGQELVNYLRLQLLNGNDD